MRDPVAPFRRRLIRYGSAAIDEHRDRSAQALFIKPEGSFALALEVEAGGQSRGILLGLVGVAEETRVLKLVPLKIPAATVLR